jgi:protein involved in polysaccharide export with SLBB domain
MSALDLLLLARSFTKSAYTLWAEIARTDTVGRISILRVDLSYSTSLATRLQEDDRLYVRQIPEWQLHPTVTLLGEVQFPGEYILTRRDETLLELIRRAGGLTSEAFPRGTIFIRSTIAPGLKRISVRQQLERSLPLLVDSLGQPKLFDIVDYEANSVNRIAIDVERIRDTEGKEGDIVLQHGDSITVPSLPSGISVVGAVGINGTIQFREDANVEYYIKRAGGFTRRADEDETRLIRANGMAYSGGSTLRQKVDLGDVIAVPTKIEREGHFARDLVTVLTVATASISAIILVSKI